MARPPSLTQPPSLEASAQGEGDAQPEAFRQLMKGIGVLAGLTHVSFCALFLWAGVDVLAWVNVGSVLSYVAVYWLAQHGQVGRAWALTVIEVLGHAVLAEWLIGWDSGFHYYVLLVIPVTVLSSIRPLVLKAATVAGVMMIYLALDVVLRRRMPPFLLPDVAVSGLQYFNVVGVMVILVFLAGFYYYLINSAEATLRKLATTDPLTQLRNRRSISEIIEGEYQRVQRTPQPLSFVVCDLDHFKAINDMHGHGMGDVVLKAVGQALSQGIREVDHLARWGGEEFLVVLPGADPSVAASVAERLRLAVQALRIDTKSAVLALTMTAGVATLQPGESTDSAIIRADAALYQGKRSSRNCVTVAP